MLGHRVVVVEDDLQDAQREQEQGRRPEATPALPVLILTEKPLPVDLVAERLVGEHLREPVTNAENRVLPS